MKLVWLQVYHNGVKVRSRYGPNINSLLAGHTLGLVVTSDNCLHLFVNGVDQGVAATNIPDHVFAVIDMYGKCAQVTLTDNSVQEARIHSNDMTNVATAAAALNTHLNSLTFNNTHNNITNTNIQVTS